MGQGEIEVLKLLLPPFSTILERLQPPNFSKSKMQMLWETFCLCAYADKYVLFSHPCQGFKQLFAWCPESFYMLLKLVQFFQHNTAQHLSLCALQIFVSSIAANLQAATLAFWKQGENMKGLLNLI